MALSGALATVTDGWSMSFQSIHFMLFLPLVTAACFLMPIKLRRPWLLLASYYFYFFAAPRHLPVLVLGTLFTYCVGRVLGGAKTHRGKNTALGIGVAGLVAGLSLFKYGGPLLPAWVEGTLGKGFFTTGAALGISFYTFTALGYLIDTWRGDVPAQKNLLTFALFLGFFANVSSGPITRAGQMMPQWEDDTRRFDAQRAADALRLMAIGFFKKLAVADMLKVYVDAVYSAEALPGYSGFTLVLAAVLFVLQLYFDFSGYTDIARGAAAMVGIDLPQNFNNPYFATNFSGFWARWHISLSSWLQDYIFTPLVWSRWPEKLPAIGKRLQKPPVLTSIVIVFLISGVWHGDTMSYLVWGALMALYRVGEELLHRFLGKPKKRPGVLLRTGKTAGVLVLWCISLVFFRVGMMGESGHVGDALGIFARSLTGFSLSDTWAVVYASFAQGFIGVDFIVYGILAFTLACTAFALWADWAQCFRLKGSSLVEGMKRLKKPVRWVLYYGMVLCCFAAFVAQSGDSFLYARY